MLHSRKTQSAATIWMLAGCAPAPIDPGVDADTSSSSFSTTSTASTVGSTDAPTETSSDAATDTSNGGFETSPESSSGGTPMCELGEPPPPAACMLAPGEPPCQPMLQDCPDGEKCIPVGLAADGSSNPTSTACVAVQRDALAIGAPCEVAPAQDADPCVEGAVCTKAPATGASWCVELCGCVDELTHCDDPSDACVFSYVPVDFVGTWGFFPMCATPCDPRDPIACGPNERCTANGGFYACAPAIGTRLQGEPCDADDRKCDEGFVCSFDYPECEEPFGCCAKSCSTHDPDACVGGTTCTAIYDEFGPPCHEGLGGCLPD